jgi:hypothetical protein
MTIDDVMALAYDLADDNVRALQPESVSQREERLRAAILALLDEEAAECALIVEEYVRMVDAQSALAFIRARIAARKGGAQP